MSGAIKQRHFWLGAALAWCLYVCNCASAAADQFSFKCERLQTGYLGYFTFDDLKKRVVAYNFLNGHIVGLLLRGNIKKASDDEIQFDLVVYYNPNLKIADFALNRKEGWMTSTRSDNADRMPCEPTPIRSVMDLWQLFESDQ